MSEICDNARAHMEKCISALSNNFSKVRTGRANPHILDEIRVEASPLPSPSLPA